MCFSEKASLVAFFTGMLGSLFCFLGKTPKHNIVGLFFAFVSLMQIVDYLLWRHKKCDDYNKTISVIGMILNHLQPIILALLVVMYMPNANKRTILTIVLVYLCFILPYSLQFLKNVECTIKDRKDWTWNKVSYAGLVYLIFTICLASLFYIPTGLIGSAVVVLTYIISNIVYPNKPGAVWCYFITGIPILYRLIH